MCESVADLGWVNYLLKQNIFWKGRAAYRGRKTRQTSKTGSVSKDLSVRGACEWAYCTCARASIYKHSCKFSRYMLEVIQFILWVKGRAMFFFVLFFSAHAIGVGVESWYERPTIITQVCIWLLWGPWVYTVSVQTPAVETDTSKLCTADF